MVALNHRLSDTEGRSIKFCLTISLTLSHLQCAAFAMVDRAVTVISALQHAQQINPKLSMGKKSLQESVAAVSLLVIYSTLQNSPPSFAVMAISTT
jgi:hypothetical protein